VPRLKTTFNKKSVFHHTDSAFNDEYSDDYYDDYYDDYGDYEDDISSYKKHSEHSDSDELLDEAERRKVGTNKRSKKRRTRASDYDYESDYLDELDFD